MEDLAVFTALSKISAQPHTKLCIQFLTRENNEKNNTFHRENRFVLQQYGAVRKLYPALNHAGSFEKNFVKLKKKKKNYLPAKGPSVQ